MSELKVMDFNYFHFYFLIYFPIFLFLELRVRVSHVVQRKKVEESRRIMLYNVYNTY